MIVDRNKLILIILLFCEIVFSLFVKVLISDDVALIVGILVFVNLIFLVFVIFNNDKEKKQRLLSISNVLGTDAQEAMIFGNIGVITYDNDYSINWVSEIFASDSSNMITYKVTRIFPKLINIISSEVETVVVEYHGKLFEVTKKEDANILFFKDVTDYQKLNSVYEEESLVLGLIHMDNYNDTVQYEEEQLISVINSNLRQPVVMWAKDHHVIIKRLRADRFLLILNEKIYEELLDDHFSIMDVVRDESAKINVNITLSMAFSRGHHDSEILDEMLSDLLGLALSRGGDQVASRVYGEDVIYYGGGSEALEKRSQVKSRVIGKTLKELFERNEKVFVVGHKGIDFDCFGAMLSASKLAQEYCDKVYVILKDVEVEAKLKEVIDEYRDQLQEMHVFISEGEGIDMIDNNSVVVSVDHNNSSLSSAPILCTKAKQLVIIDHHRRKESIYNNASLVYIESSSSSSCELMAELLAYQPTSVVVTSLEATLMYTGIIVDTNRFRVRSGNRTFVAAGLIKTMGANIGLADDFLKDDYNLFMEKSRIYNNMEIYFDNIIISTLNDKYKYSRSVISQGADMLLQIENIKAAFVIAYENDNLVIITARSDKDFNVQLVMEAMNGGGHFTSAASQIESKDINAIKEKLIKVIEEKLKNKE
ncbi:MAG: DHH family phosphoesterase [Erysipelotrichaceae bacterium]